MDSIVNVSGLRKTFKVGNQDVQVLKGLNLTINAGDFVIIFGPSGCGKSTLLNIVLGLEPPSEGTITFLGEDLYADKTEDQQADFRKKHIGMVFQQANWIKSLKVLENVAFPLLLMGQDKLESIQKAIKMLDQLQMLQWASYFPTELSGGQQQRISLARALINNPEIVFADEPTGNLDYKSGQDIMKLLFNMNKQQGKTVVMVTHDLEYLRYADTAVQMLDGEIIDVYQEKDMEKLTSELQFKRVSKIKATKDSNEQVATEENAQTDQPA